jgi:hypothetical protein
MLLGVLRAVTQPAPTSRAPSPGRR